MNLFQAGYFELYRVEKMSDLSRGQFSPHVIHVVFCINSHTEFLYILYHLNSPVIFSVKNTYNDIVIICVFDPQF